MTPEQLRSFCVSFNAAVEEFPFPRVPEVSAFKVGGKIFALTTLDARPLTVNLKCEPEAALRLRGEYPGSADRWKRAMRTPSAAASASSCVGWRSRGNPTNGSRMAPGPLRWTSSSSRRATCSGSSTAVASARTSRRRSSRLLGRYNSW